MSDVITRRHLSGVYIFCKFPEEERRQPTCVEDCDQETRTQWIHSLEKEAAYQLCDHLLNTLERILDLADYKDERQKKDTLGQIDWIRIDLDNKDINQLRKIAERICKSIRGVADLYDIRVQDNDEEGGEL